MGRVIVIEHLTLDGVMQAPGHADEDQRDGFQYGGWASRAQDPAMQEVMGARMSSRWSLLAGRTTYERFADYWPKQKPNPFTTALNRVQKYVASTTLAEPLAWQNSTLLKGDAADAVAGLKEELEENLVVFGSGVLVRSLMQHHLVDEFVLLIYPLVLGPGRRLFPDSGSDPLAFGLVESTTTRSGVIIAIYQADLPGTIHHDDTGVRQRLGGHSLGMPREKLNPDARRTALPQLTLQRGRPAGTIVGVLPVSSWAFCRSICGRSSDSRRSLLHPSWAGISSLGAIRFYRGSALIWSVQYSSPAALASSRSEATQGAELSSVHSAAMGRAVSRSPKESCCSPA